MIKSWHHHKRRNCRCSVAPSLPYIDEAGWSWARKVYSLACPAYCLPLRAHSTYTNSCFDGIPVRHWQSLQSVPQFLAVLSILSTSDPLPYKQSLSDKSGIMSARDLVKSSYSDFRPITESYVPGCSISSRWLLAPCVIHHGVWSSAIWWGRPGGCGSPSRMQRVCITFLSMRITGDNQGLHGLVCKQAPSRIIRHRALNDVVARAVH